MRNFGAFNKINILVVAISFILAACRETTSFKGIETKQRTEAVAGIGDANIEAAAVPGTVSASDTTPATAPATTPDTTTAPALRWWYANYQEVPDGAYGYCVYREKLVMGARTDYYDSNSACCAGYYSWQWNQTCMKMCRQSGQCP